MRGEHNSCQAELLTCRSQSFSGALTGRSMMPSQSTWTRWKVSHPMVAAMLMKGEASSAALVLLEPASPPLSVRRLARSSSS